MTLNLNPENKRIKNGSARLKIPSLKSESGIFFLIFLKKDMKIMEKIKVQSDKERIVISVSS